MITEEVLEAVMPGGALGGVLGVTAMYFWYLQSTYEFMLLDGWPVAAALEVAFAYFIAKAIFPRRRGPVAFLLAPLVACAARPVERLRRPRDARLVV